MDDHTIPQTAPRASGGFPEVPLAECEPELLLRALTRLLHRHAARYATWAASSDRRTTRTDKARYRDRAAAITTEADDFPNLVVIRLPATGELYALDMEERIDRESEAAA
jgi:hypothetical protein